MKAPFGSAVPVLALVGGLILADQIVLWSFGMRELDWSDPRGRVVLLFGLASRATPITLATILLVAAGTAAGRGAAWSTRLGWVLSLAVGAGLAALVYDLALLRGEIPDASLPRFAAGTIRGTLGFVILLAVGIGLVRWGRRDSASVQA